jgi:hypothetical protein
LVYGCTKISYVDGGLRTIVTDNGAPMKAAVQWIDQKWGIKHITISPYNSQANGRIERPHWDIRQMLYKATGEYNTKQWYWFLSAVLWADRTSIRKRTGCSPYYMLTGAHPILPLDAKEATWLVDPPNGVITETELIGMRARALAKHRVHVEQMRKRIDQEKLKWIQTYERDYGTVIKDYKFKPGDLVLLRHTAIESSLDKKMKPRYNGPMIVIKETKGGSYVLAEMTGVVLPFKCAKFRVIPYFARRRIALPEGVMKIINLTAAGVGVTSIAPVASEGRVDESKMEDLKICWKTDGPNRDSKSRRADSSLEKSGCSTKSRRSVAAITVPSEK